MQRSPGKLWGMRRLSDARGIFKMIAVDQRPPITRPIAKHLGVDKAPWDHVARFKRMLIEELQAPGTAMLLDPHYAIPAGLDRLSPQKGFVATLEDSVFEEARGGRLSRDIDNWSVEKIKRLGADAVKVLIWYRPDADSEICARQQDYAKRIGDACARYDIPFVLELLVYPLASDKATTGDYVEMPSKRTDHVLASVEEFARAEYGVDLFKLESPVAAAAADGSAAVQEAFDELGRIAGRPWVVLSAGAGKPEFRSVLEHAFRAGASGFLAGRAIWLDAFQLYPDWSQMQAELASGALAYMSEISQLADSAAVDWRRNPAYGAEGSSFSPVDAAFRQSYSAMGA